MDWLVVMHAWDPPEDAPLCWPSETVRALAALGHKVEVMAGLVPYHATAPPNVSLQGWHQRGHRGEVDWESFFNHASQAITQERHRQTMSFVHHLPARIMHLWSRIGESHQPQGVHDHWPWPFSWYVAVRNKFQAYRTPLWQLELKALLDPQVEKIISVSPAMTRGFRADGVPGEKILELPPGVLLPAVVPNQEQHRAALRERLGIDPQSLVMLWPTPGMPREWFDSAMSALSGFLPRHPQLQVLMCGDLAHHHHFQAVDLNIRERVRLLPTAGHMHRLMALADFALNLTPATGSVSRHTLMSLACGVPVVTHAGDGACHWLQGTGQQGAGVIMAKPQEPDEITNAIEQMIQNSSRTWFEHVARSVAPNFTMDRHVQTLVQALR